MDHNNLDLKTQPWSDEARVADSLKNSLEGRLGYQLRRASVTMMASLAKRMAHIGVTTTEASILILVADNPTVTQTELARTLGIKRANMVPLVTGLMARKLLAREPADGRSHALHLTAAGAQVVRQAQRQMQDHENHYFGGLSAAESKRLLAMLRAVWDIA